jgi:hypothetical protein
MFGRKDRGETPAEDPPTNVAVQSGQGFVQITQTVVGDGEADLSSVISQAVAGAMAGMAASGRPRWKLPPECPNCGAKVDQAVQSAEADPRCGFCHDPIPAEPVEHHVTALDMGQLDLGALMQGAFPAQMPVVPPEVGSGPPA